jgi:hypothetical protein
MNAKSVWFFWSFAPIGLAYPIILALPVPPHHDQRHLARVQHHYLTVLSHRSIAGVAAFPRGEAVKEPQKRAAFRAQVIDFSLSKMPKMRFFYSLGAWE